VGAYRQLIEWYRKGDVSFAHTKSVTLDEYRGLPAQHKESYRHFMRENFFDDIDIDARNTHVPDGMAPDAAAECRRYDELIDSLGGIDLQLLGIGLNGHIGFNEPAEHFIMQTHCITLSESTRNANARFFDGDMDQVPKEAITMGMRHIMQARRILLIAGAEKRDILEQALYGPVTPQVPASLLQLHENLTVITCI
jgi:glucosamine-6-phosphate deaminase